VIVANHVTTERSRDVDGESRDDEAVIGGSQSLVLTTVVRPAVLVGEAINAHEEASTRGRRGDEIVVTEDGARRQSVD